MSLPVIGESIHLIVPEGKFKGHYKSNVFDINQKHIFIYVPIDTTTSALVQLPKGTKIHVDYSDAAHVPCSFETIVEKSALERNDLQTIKRPEPKGIKRNQRREYVRVPAPFAIEMTANSQTIQCEMRDISGGGLSVFLPKQVVLSPREPVSISFGLKINGDLFAVNALASVIRVQEGESDESGNASDSTDSPLAKFNICSLKFADIKENDRQRIIQYVFHYQIRIKERELSPNRK